MTDPGFGNIPYNGYQLVITNINQPIICWPQYGNEETTGRKTKKSKTNVYINRRRMPGPHYGVDDQVN